MTFAVVSVTCAGRLWHSKHQFCSAKCLRVLPHPAAPVPYFPSPFYQGTNQKLMQMETPSLFLGLSNFLSYSATTLLQAYSSSSRYYSFHQIFLTSLSIAPRCISKIINKKQKTLICGQYALALADCFSSDHGLLTDLYLTLRLPELHCPVMSNCQLCRIQPLHCSLASSSA